MSLNVVLLVWFPNPLAAESDFFKLDGDPVYCATGGFAGVLGPEAENSHVFERAFKPKLQTVLSGGTASLLCYGYTGSGKTHTVLGSGGEEGLYYKAAGELLSRLKTEQPD